MRRARGQALVELALTLPLLLALVAIPVAAAAWGHRQLDTLDSAREAVWAATVGGRSADVGARVERRRSGLVRAEATVDAPVRVSPFLEPDPVDPGRLEHLVATLELDTLSLEAGTEAAGIRAVRDRWHGGLATAPLRTMIKLLIRDEPVRVDFDVRPPARRRP